MRFHSVLLALCLAAPAFAGDALIDAFNAEKTRIAEQFKTASDGCKTAKDAASCKKAASKTRQDALIAASKERDTGLKCRATCGLVTEIKQEERDGEGSMVGTVGGGVAGAVIGRKLAGDASSANKNVATAVGAVGGALIGKKIEQKISKHSVWVVNAQLYNGEAASSSFNDDPKLVVGDKVELKDGKISKR